MHKQGGRNSDTQADGEQRDLVHTALVTACIFLQGGTEDTVLPTTFLELLRGGQGAEASAFMLPTGTLRHGTATKTYRKLRALDE